MELEACSLHRNTEDAVMPLACSRFSVPSSIHGRKKQERHTSQFSTRILERNTTQDWAGCHSLAHTSPYLLQLCPQQTV